MNGLVHNFEESLALSLRLNEESDWVAFYKRIWPDATLIVRVDKYSEMQKQGIDRMVWLPSGKQILIDEKCRDKDYGDILLETVSVAKRDGNGLVVEQKVGWALDDSKHCDFIAYAIPNASKCYLLPFEIMKEAVRHNLQKWKTTLRVARNKGYETHNVAVKWVDLAFAMQEQMYRKFGSNIQLPEATKNACQLEFNW